MLSNKLVLATQNLHKQQEMKNILSSLRTPIIGLDEFPQIGDIEETGTTLTENAFIKAKAVFEFTRLPSLADDTGLEVDSLNGAPGVYSARYAGQNATYKENCDKLLTNLEGLSKDQRTATFKTVIAFFDGKIEHHTEGMVKGIIVDKCRGEDGFGYDPIFMPQSSNMTYAQMDIKHKNSISHRFKALEKMKSFLAPYFKTKGETIGLK